MSVPTPKVVKPKVPVEADAAADQGKAAAQASRPKGAESFVSAGKLNRKAYTLKASLSGGA